MVLQVRFVCVLALLAVSTNAQADPCGMVPPLYMGPGDPIERVGAQKTYVFYKDGVESIVLRPAFRGKVEHFGMLIPFPSPPAIRKVPDNIFGQLGAAIDPPVISVWVRQMIPPPLPSPVAGTVVLQSARRDSAQRLSIHAVRVLRKEAVGMYQVAVLQAGSPMALKRWMKKNGYQYPKGMDRVVGEYVTAQWSFVAVKTKVADKSSVSPRPGMRKAKGTFPKGGYFKGAVQAMGFRFRTRKLVVPMRLSAFNKGRLRNIVYLLTDGPRRIAHIDTRYVRRQLSGAELYRNITGPLPLRLLGGTADKIQPHRWKWIQLQRDPEPHNGLAKDLFASDLLAVKQGRLALPFEETKKVFLRIGERLLLRGKNLDHLHHHALSAHREEAIALALGDLRKMTLTVVDGDFPREILARENLSFDPYTMPSSLNTSKLYDARSSSLRKAGQPNAPGSRLYRGSPASHPWKSKHVQRQPPPKKRKKRTTQRKIARLIRSLRDPNQVDAALRQLQALGTRALRALQAEAFEDQPLVRRGWAIVAMTAIKAKRANQPLEKLARGRHPTLVRAWAVAGRFKRMHSLQELQRYRNLASITAALRRPLRKTIERLTSSNTKSSLDTLFSIALWGGTTQQVVAPQILAFGEKSLIRHMLLAKQDQSRRLAASFVATAGGKRTKQTIQAMLTEIRFRPGATNVPWKGGALFLPSLSWSRGTARELVTHLIAWMVWADRRGRSPLHRQIHNMLRSWQLSRTAGYRSPGWGKTSTVNQWLTIYGQMAGCTRLQDLLRRQAVARDHRYQPALKALRCH